MEGKHYFWQEGMTAVMRSFVPSVWQAGLNSRCLDGKKERQMECRLAFWQSGKLASKKARLKDGMPAFRNDGKTA